MEGKKSIRCRTYRPNQTLTLVTTLLPTDFTVPTGANDNSSERFQYELEAIDTEPLAIVAA